MAAAAAAATVIDMLCGHCNSAMLDAELTMAQHIFDELKELLSLRAKGWRGLLVVKQLPTALDLLKDNAYHTFVQLPADRFKDVFVRLDAAVSAYGCSMIWCVVDVLVKPRDVLPLAPVLRGRECDADEVRA